MMSDAKVPGRMFVGRQIEELDFSGDRSRRRVKLFGMQVGEAGFFVDLAIVDPDLPGRYLLGIECYGATYHSSRSARDRDRLRQQLLEDRGWIIHRIWSTDWFHRPDEQLRKTLEAIGQAKSELIRRECRTKAPTESNPESGSEEAATIERDERIDATRSPHGSPGGRSRREVTRLLGFRQTGPQLRETMFREIERLTDSAKVEVRNGKLYPSRVTDVLEEQSR